MRQLPVDAGDLVHIGPCFRVGRHPTIPHHRSFARVVAGQRQADIALEIGQQPPQIGHSALQALHRIVGIAHAESFGGLGNQLHQPLGVLGRTSLAIEAGLRLDHRQHEIRLQTVIRGHAVDHHLDLSPFRRGHPWACQELRRWRFQGRIDRLGAFRRLDAGRIVHPRQHPRGRGIALGRRQPEPGRRLGIVPRHAPTVGVHPPQLILRLSMTASGRRAVQSHCPVIILGNTLAVFVAHRPFHLDGRDLPGELDPVGTKARRTLRAGAADGKDPDSEACS